VQLEKGTPGIADVAGNISLLSTIHSSSIHFTHIKLFFFVAVLVVACCCCYSGKTKDEMNDFVSFYRRFSGIQGRQSFSLLYTSINVLAGHYTSYGLKFPVPEKRRKRLLQEMLDIEKNIRKRR